MMDIASVISNKYSYLSKEDVELLINRAKGIAIDQLYPNDLSINYLNFKWQDYPRFDTWLLDCVEELIERSGISSVVAYSENGMSWRFDRSGVSQSLIDRLPRNVVAIK